MIDPENEKRENLSDKIAQLGLCVQEPKVHGCKEKVAATWASVYSGLRQVTRRGGGVQYRPPTGQPGTRWRRPDADQGKGQNKWPAGAALTRRHASHRVSGARIGDADARSPQAFGDRIDQIDLFRANLAIFSCMRVQTRERESW